MVEREVKLRFGSAEEARDAVLAIGATPMRERRFQDDALFDNEREDLRQRRCALRLRREGSQSYLTFKGPVQPGPMKLREELETPGRPVVASLSNGDVKVHDLIGGSDQINQSDIRADEIMSYRDSIYFRNRDKVFELLFTKAGHKTIVSSRLAANVLEHASRLYEGVAIQNLLGEPHISIFARPGACYQIKLTELKGSRVVDAKFDSGVLMIRLLLRKVYITDGYLGLTRIIRTMTLEKSKTFSKLD